MTSVTQPAPYPPIAGAEPCTNDPELFFPEMAHGGTAAARKLCSLCDVQQQCLAYALTHDEYGVWGGTTHEERQHIQRKRGIRPVVGSRPTDRALIIRAHGRGMPASVIAALAGVNEHTVFTTLQKHRNAQESA